MKSIFNFLIGVGVILGVGLHAESPVLTQNKVKQIFAGKPKKKDIPRELFKTEGTPVVATESSVNKIFKSFEEERREEIARREAEKQKKAKEAAERKAKKAKEAAEKARLAAEKKKHEKAPNYGLSSKMVAKYIKKGHSVAEAKKIKPKRKSAYKPVNFRLVVLGFIKKGEKISLMTNIGTLVEGGTITPTNEKILKISDEEITTNLRKIKL